MFVIPKSAVAKMQSPDFDFAFEVDEKKAIGLPRVHQRFDEKLHKVVNEVVFEVDDPEKRDSGLVVNDFAIDALLLLGDDLKRVDFGDVTPISSASHVLDKFDVLSSIVVPDVPSEPSVSFEPSTPSEPNV